MQLQKTIDATKRYSCLFYYTFNLLREEMKQAVLK